MRIAKRITAAAVSVVLVFAAVSLVTGGRNSELVVIYSNGDDEAITAMKETLDENGYEGKYILQSFGTSELGGKILAEGSNLEADPVYKDMISVTDISSSSTAWLLIQALVSEYGEEEAQEILTKIYENAGPHIEDSGSGPLKKVRAGEVAVGFGLRHQAVADKEAGLPVYLG